MVFNRNLWGKISINFYSGYFSAHVLPYALLPPPSPTPGLLQPLLMSSLLLRKNLINAIDSHEDIITWEGPHVLPHRVVILPLFFSLPDHAVERYYTIFKPLFHPQTGTFWPSFVLKNRTNEPCVVFAPSELHGCCWAHYTGFPPNKVPPSQCLNSIPPTRSPLRYWTHQNE